MDIIVINDSPEPEGREVITIESSPEPEKQPAKGTRMHKPKRTKKTVRKVSVPLLAEINKMRGRRLRWYINHYNFGVVDDEGNKKYNGKGLGEFFVNDLKELLQSCIQTSNELKKEQYTTTQLVMQSHELAQQTKKDAQIALTKKRAVAADLLLEADCAITLVENIKNISTGNVYLKNTRLKEKTAEALQLSNNAELAAKEVSELEGIIQKAQIDEKTAAKRLF
jgi:hypothetical protein